MQALTDYSKGPPTQAGMLSSLLTQVVPALAAMSPILTILNTFSAIKDFSSDPLNPNAVIKLGKALDKAINLIDPAAFVVALKSVLQLVIGYLEAFIEAMGGLLAYQASIDFSIAQGNSDLMASLENSSSNASVSIQQLMLSLGPIAPIMALIQPFIALSGASISLPSIASLQAEQDVAKALKTLATMLATLQQVLEAL
jgi:hypothetical protein